MTSATHVQRRVSSRTVRSHLLIGALTACSSACAGLPGLAPNAFFVQAGMAESAETLSVGFSWDGSWQRDFAYGRLTSYWEASIGRWLSDTTSTGRASAWVTQLGITPVLRWHPRSWNERWFLEAGIGANVLLPIYRSEDKEFSTAFNFGDHIAIGRRFGDTHHHELMLRFQHFSNAGIKRPNPGEDFVQLRYVRRF